MGTLLADSVKGRLLFAVPKKGRLHEQLTLAGADIKYFRSHRLDIALVQNHPIALLFLNASDIPQFVGSGNVDLGITGQDQIAESGLTSKVNEVLPLGFGKCRLQVQVPESSPFQTVQQLSGKRIATSFEFVAGEYFGRIDKEVEASRSHEEPSSPTKIQYIGGSVEAACALGLADGIVDLVESGETMRAAGLHPIATILETQAVLITSKAPHSTTSTNPVLVELIEKITKRIQGVIASSKFVLCTYNVRRADMQQAVEITRGKKAATVSPLEREEEWVAINVMVERATIADVMDKLQVIGAEDILVTKLENCRV
ncbi:HisG-domain-containing protein [Cantharellus anzutake]|uniref:HisG-domain-containing protein n=1 Tax=Cantharellus anzutake TaxID=1750568 RepID=UPI001908D064|nr:HisG-domain-containing protein [Cantharellus anzutake]KAF8324769.1 HisG-domain-containing protein [Cantharellus anzutake]